MGYMTEIGGDDSYIPYKVSDAELRKAEEPEEKENKNTVEAMPTHPRLRKQKRFIDRSMLPIFRLMDEKGISYTGMADMLGLDKRTISLRMANGTSADLRAEMMQALKNADTLTAMLPVPQEAVKKRFTHPGLYNAEYAVSRSMLPIWDLLNDQGISYPAYAAMLNIKSSALSARMRNGVRPELYKKMLRTLTGEVPEPAIEPEPVEPVDNTMACDAEMWHEFLDFVCASDAEAIGANVLQKILQIMHPGSPAPDDCECGGLPEDSPSEPPGRILCEIPQPSGGALAYASKKMER